MALEKIYEERIQHRTAKLPIALHKLEYLEGTNIVFYLHWHKEFEFLVVTKGLIQFTIEDRTYLLNAGDCIFVNSNFYHSAKTINGNSCGFFAFDFSWEFLHEDIYSSFGRKYIRPILEGKLIFPEVIRLTAIPPVPWQVQAINLLYEISNCQVESLASHELMIISRIYSAWELFYNNAVFKNTENDKAFTKKNHIKPVIDYIKRNYSDEITLTELSGIIPMSEGQFCRVFKEAMKLFTLSVSDAIPYHAKL